MKVYFSFFRLRFLALLQYRSAAIAGLCTQILFGLVRVFIFIGFLSPNEAAVGVTVAQTVSYVWVGQAILGLLPWNLEPELDRSVRSGLIAYELSRPLDIYNMWFARVLAHRSAPTLMRCVPLMLITTLLFPAPYNLVFPDGLRALASLAALLGALLLSTSISTLLNITVLWTVDSVGLVRFMPAVVQLFSGMIIPLTLFPDNLQKILHYQPFMGLVDGPAQILSGSAALSTLPSLLALQVGWSAALILFGRWLLRRGMKRITVAGG
ncbi:MAG: ABC-2 family transporter protein [Clostridia bacterium]|nr:ABC-2 family transporter protein [Clostridia bacterium]